MKPKVLITFYRDNKFIGQGFVKEMSDEKDRMIVADKLGVYRTWDKYTLDKGRARAYKIKDNKYSFKVKYGGYRRTYKYDMIKERTTRRQAMIKYLKNLFNKITYGKQ